MMMIMTLNATKLKVPSIFGEYKIFYLTNFVQIFIDVFNDLLQRKFLFT